MALTVYASPLGACSCIEPPPPKDALKEADCVFIGKLVSYDYLDTNMRHSKFGSSATQYRHIFAVEKLWKGLVKDTIEIICGRDGASCGYYFREDQRYVVYAYKGRKDSTRLVTSLCTRTRSISRATEDLKDLGEGIKVR
jgi:hypothetical protein